MTIADRKFGLMHQETLVKAMSIPQLDVHGKPFTERDRKLLELLLRPNGATKYELNRATNRRLFEGLTL
jgi:hypothetical protein